MLDPAVGMVITAGLALLLLTGAWHKLRAHAEFADALAGYRLVPYALLPACSWLLPGLEALIAAALLVPRSRAPAVWSGCGLLLAYAGAIAINLGRGRRDLDCGCAGPNQRRPIAWWMVWRNLLLAALLGVATLRWSARPLTFTDALTVGGALTGAAILYHALDLLLGQVIPRGAALRRAS